MCSDATSAISGSTGSEDRIGSYGSCEKQETGIMDDRAACRS